MPSEDLQRALALAQQCRERAYAPYSGFAVGAGIIAQNGEAFGGANVENVSYGLTICAERSAAAAAVAAGVRTFRAIAVAGPPDRIAVPCGACRQFLSEFTADLVVGYTTPSGFDVTSLNELLPHPFDTGAKQSRSAS